MPRPRARNWLKVSDKQTRNPATWCPLADCFSSDTELGKAFGQRLAGDGVCQCGPCHLCPATRLGHCREEQLRTRVRERPGPVPIAFFFIKTGSGRRLLRASSRVLSCREVGGLHTAIIGPSARRGKSSTKNKTNERNETERSSEGGTAAQRPRTYLVLQHVACHVPVRRLRRSPGQGGRVLVDLDDLEEGWLAGNWEAQGQGQTLRSPRGLGGPWVSLCHGQRAASPGSPRSRRRAETLASALRTPHPPHAHLLLVSGRRGARSRGRRPWSCRRRPSGGTR